MGWPQVIWIVWASVAVGVACANDGESRQYDGFGQLMTALLMACLLYAGGFFG